MMNNNIEILIWNKFVNNMLKTRKMEEAEVTMPQYGNLHRIKIKMILKIVNNKLLNIKTVKDIKKILEWDNLNIILKKIEYKQTTEQVSL